MSPRDGMGTTNVLDRAAERLVNMDNADYADERERAVYLEAQAFGMQLSLLTCWLGALFFALFGQILAPLALLLLPLIPVLGARWYGHRRGVSEDRITARGPVLKTLAWTGFYGLLLLATSLAMIHRAYYGQGFWEPAVTVEVVGEELQNAMVVGAVIGLPLAAVVGVLMQGWTVWSERRKERRELEEADEQGAASAPQLPSWALTAGVGLGAVVALLGQLPWILGGRDGFVAVVTVGSLAYGIAVVLLCVTLQRRRRP